MIAHAAYQTDDAHHVVTIYTDARNLDTRKRETRAMCKRYYIPRNYKMMHVILSNVSQIKALRNGWSRPGTR